MRFLVSGVGHRVYGSERGGERDPDRGLVSGFGFRVSGFGFRVSGFMGWGLGLGVRERGGGVTEGERERGR